MTTVEVEPQTIAPIPPVTGVMLRAEVAGPPFSSLPGNLYTAATVRDHADGRVVPVVWDDVWPLGSPVTSWCGVYACGGSHNKANAYGEPNWVASAEPCLVYAADACAPVGRDEAEVEARVRALLDIGEPMAVASNLITAIAGSGAGNLTDKGPVLSADWALGYVLECLCNRAGQGVIWASSTMLALLSQYLYRDGDVLRTIVTDTPVVHACGLARGEIYLTGPVLIERGPVEVLSSIDKGRNLRVVLAERVWTGAVAKPWCKATVTAPA